MVNPYYLNADPNSKEIRTSFDQALFTRVPL